jgi:hypothetical protein
MELSIQWNYPFNGIIHSTNVSIKGSSYRVVKGTADSLAAALFGLKESARKQQ